MEEIINHNNSSTTRTALKFGLITSIGLVGFFITIELVNPALNNTVGFLYSIIHILGIVYGILEYRKLNEGFISYVQGLGLGLSLSAVSGFVLGLSQLLYYRLISDSTLQYVLKVSRAELEKNPDVKDDFIDAYMDMMAKIITPEGMFLITLFSYLIGGLVLSLIISAILQKKRPIFD